MNGLTSKLGYSFERLSNGSLRVRSTTVQQTKRDLILKCVASNGIGDGLEKQVALRTYGTIA